VFQLPRCIDRPFLGRFRSGTRPEGLKKYRFGKRSMDLGANAMSHPLKVLLFAFILFVDSSCGVSSGVKSEDRSPARVTADQIAIELGLPSNSPDRTIPSADLSKYSLQVDVFRQSTDRPTLGAFRPEYVSALVPESSLPESTRTLIAKRRFAKLASLEFAVWSRGGIPFRVNLVSVGASAENGNFRLDTVDRTTRLQAEDGPSVPVSIPFPWLRSEALPSEPMTWGLWIQGGYFVQSTSDYADLGLPAVNGGVHQSLPDSMDLYTAAQDEPTALRIHAAGSAEASARLALFGPVEAILAEIDASQQQIAEVINLLGPDVRLLGHGWVDPLSGDFKAPTWPKCGGFDCFKAWSVERPGNTPAPRIGIR
jgi:hypothetical protein